MILDPTYSILTNVPQKQLFSGEECSFLIPTKQIHPINATILFWKDVSRSFIHISVIRDIDINSWKKSEYKSREVKTDRRKEKTKTHTYKHTNATNYSIHSSCSACPTVLSTYEECERNCKWCEWSSNQVVIILLSKSNTRGRQGSAHYQWCRQSGMIHQAQWSHSVHAKAPLSLLVTLYSYLTPLLYLIHSLHCLCRSLSPVTSHIHALSNPWTYSSVLARTNTHTRSYSHTHTLTHALPPSHTPSLPSSLTHKHNHIHTHTQRKATAQGLEALSMRGYILRYLQQYPELLDLVANDTVESTTSR